MTRHSSRRAAPDVQAQLDAVYASLPSIECRGQCWDSCGSIGMTRVEQRRIAEQHGRTLPLVAAFAAQGDGLCPALTMLGRCSVYADRPLICRLWGLVPSMACNFGCRPEGGLMAERDGHLALARVAEIAGDHGLAAQIRALWEDPDVAAETERRLRRLEAERKVAWEARRNLAEARGSALFIGPGGRIARERTGQAS